MTTWNTWGKVHYGKKTPLKLNPHKRQLKDIWQVRATKEEVTRSHTRKWRNRSEHARYEEALRQKAIVMICSVLDLHDPHILVLTFILQIPHFPARHHNYVDFNFNHWRIVPVLCNCCQKEAKPAVKEQKSDIEHRTRLLKQNMSSPHGLQIAKDWNKPPLRLISE